MRARKSSTPWRSQPPIRSWSIAVTAAEMIVPPRIASRSFLQLGDDRISHCARADSLSAKRDVGGARSAGYGALHCAFDPRSNGFQAKAEAQHQRPREHLRTRIRDAFASDVGRGPASGFIEAERQTERILPRAQ